MDDEDQDIPDELEYTDVQKQIRPETEDQARLIRFERDQHPMTFLPYNSKCRVDALQGMSPALEGLMSRAMNDRLPKEMYLKKYTPYPATKMLQQQACAAAFRKELKCDPKRLKPIKYRYDNHVGFYGALMRLVRFSWLPLLVR